MIDLAARALEALDGATTANGQNPAIGTHAGTSQKCGEAHFALATE
jgi:hypothetical protein